MTISLDSLPKNPEVAATIRKVMAAGYYVSGHEKYENTTTPARCSEFLCVALSSASADALITVQQAFAASKLIQSSLTRGTLSSHLVDTCKRYQQLSERYGHSAECVYKLRLQYWENLLNSLER